MMFRLLRFLGVSSLLILPTAAQFGVGKRKKATSFEDLNEQAKQQGGGAGAGADLLGQLNDLGGMGDLEKLMQNVDMEKMQEMWKDALNNPETMKQMESFGNQFGEALQELSKMAPDELEKQMKDAMDMITSGDMVDTIVGKREEVLKTLEETKAVPPEELARYKADPKYFELKMREQFDQMKGIFDDPELLNAGINALKESSQMMKELSKAFDEDLDNDEKIEEARLELLKNPELAAAFQSDEMQELLTDPKKWKETVRMGREAMTQGAGVGEL